VAPQHDNVAVLHHGQNQGYGRALRTGGLAAGERGFAYVVFMDSDLTNDPEYLPLFVDKMYQGYDVIKASRYMAGGGTRGVPWWRVWISRAGNAVARRLYGVPLHDCTNGYRAIRTAVFRTLELEENRFALIMEELWQACLRGCSFAEVPNVLGNRGAERRPTSFSYRPATFYRYLRYPWKTFLHRLGWGGRRDREAK
jgi:dolichol-phosphate mannosyltransferase